MNEITDYRRGVVKTARDCPYGFCIDGLENRAKD